MSKILKVGLTGGIGSGKSTACKYFRSYGVPVIDADKIAHELVEPGKPALEKLINITGKEYLSDDNVLDRKAIRRKIFEDYELKKHIEELLHPLVYIEIEKQIVNIEYPYTIISVPLLIESNGIDKFDRILVIDVPDNIRINRIKKRDGISENEILAIINAQVTREARLEVADDIIHNDKDEDYLVSQVNKLHSYYLEIAG